MQKYEIFCKSVNNIYIICVIYVKNAIIMLIKFSVRNFKTFRQKAELSMVASNYDKDREADNVTELKDFGMRVLKSAVIYGANASGKSKLMEAMFFMKSFVLSSSKESQKGEAIDVEPFKLNTISENEPTEFEVVFNYLNEQFRYGFEATSKEIVSEWLYHKPNTKEVELFTRAAQEFSIHSRSFSTGKMLVKKKFVRENALMLSAAAQWNDEIAGHALDWFRSFRVISGLDEDSYAGFTMSRSTDPEHKEKHLEFLRNADLDIQDISLEKLDLNRLSKDMPAEIRDLIEKKMKESKADDFISDVLISHKKYDESKKYVGDVKFSLREDESSGTLKFFFLSGPILDAISNGYIFVVDELDSKLHPNLVCKIVEIFNSQDLNPNNAQLIFNTHDTNLLSAGVFRRDQIWFTEKNRYGEVSLYSLGDFKTDEVRKGDNFERNYIQGKYGAIPYLGDFSKLLVKNSSPAYENEKQKAGGN